MAADGVRAVEHDDLDAVAGAGLHRVRHSPDVGVVARADVLDVEDHRVEAREHLLRRHPRRSVETPDGKACLGIGRIRDFDQVLGGRAESMLGAEEDREIHFPSSVQEVDSVAQRTVDGGGVGDETDTLPHDAIDLPFEEPFQPGHDLRAHPGIIAFGESSRKNWARPTGWECSRVGPAPRPTPAERRASDSVDERVSTQSAFFGFPKIVSRLNVPAPRDAI
jgi:hypothetical protein